MCRDENNNKKKLQVKISGKCKYSILSNILIKEIIAIIEMCDTKKKGLYTVAGIWTFCATA